MSMPFARPPDRAVDATAETWIARWVRMLEWCAMAHSDGFAGGSTLLTRST